MGDYKNVEKYFDKYLGTGWEKSRVGFRFKSSGFGCPVTYL